MRKICLLVATLYINLPVQAADTCDQYCNSNYSKSSQNEAKEACKVGFGSVSGFANEKGHCEMRYSTSPLLKEICVQSSLVYLMNCRS